jgi:hypothetical protein
MYLPISANLGSVFTNGVELGSREKSPSGALGGLASSFHRQRLNHSRGDDLVADFKLTRRGTAVEGTPGSKTGEDRLCGAGNDFHLHGRRHVQVRNDSQQGQDDDGRCPLFHGAMYTPTRPVAQEVLGLIVPLGEALFWREEARRIAEIRGSF